nr:hypothetical protein GCM10020093_104260 [Planobispora longispora]
MVNLTVTRLLRDRALADPDGVALIVRGSAPLTYGQWEERSTEIANGLLGRGVTRGDRVGLVFGSGDWTDYAVAFFGVLKAGAAAVPLSDRLAPADLRFMLGHCGAAGSSTPRGGRARRGLDRDAGGAARGGRVRLRGGLRGGNLP